MDLMEENKTQFKDNEEVIEIELYDIKPNPDQPRTIFDETSLRELAQSIKEHGVFQPIIVKPLSVGYMLVAGERRVKAATIAGLRTVPAIVRDYNSIYLSELAILENLQREDLTPIEEAIAFQKAVHNLQITHEELGKKIGKSRAYVTNIIGLLHLPTTVIQSVNSGNLSMGHARALSKLKDHELCLTLHDRVLEEKLTVRDIERIIRSINSNKKIGVSKEVLKNQNHVLHEKISDTIKYKLGKSQLIFYFDNEDELKSIVDYIKGDDDK
jgi:ParB family chromosome partitioning protein